MNLINKKELAKKVLGVGKNRIIFSQEGLNEIKEAITKQDILSMHQEGLILIKPIKGRKTVVRRKTKRGPGKIRRTIKKRKQTYVKITRKLRRYVKELKNQAKIDLEMYKALRGKIRMRYFKSKAHLKEYLENEMKIKGLEQKDPSQESKLKKQIKKTTKTKEEKK